MLNIVNVQGRLTKDPEVRNTSNQNAVCSFSIACERPFKNDTGKAETDFIDCVAWRGKATLVGQHFKKGDMILITGRLQKRAYDDNTGKKVYVTEVLVEDVNFCMGASSKAQTPPPPPIIESDEALPFDI